MKKFIMLFAVIAFVFGVTMVAIPSTASAAAAGGTRGAVSAKVAAKFQFYGYVKFLACYEDSHQRLDGAEIITPSQMRNGPNTTNGENGRLNFNARQTRFGWFAFGDSFSGWKTSGRMEFDSFGGGGNHHGENIRMRIGELYLTKGNTKITMGKGWAMFGTRRAANVENFTNIVGAGFRRAVRFDIAQKFPSGENTFGVDLMVMTYDDDKGGFNTEWMGFPYTSLELSLVSKAMGYAGGRPLGLWLQGIYGNMAQPDDLYKDGEKLANSGDDYDTYGVELDFYVPIISSKDRGKKAGNLAFQGNVYVGQALGNAASLNVGYTYVPDPEGKPHEVEGWGGWCGLSYWACDTVNINVYGGYEEIDTKNYFPGSMVEDAYEITGNVWWHPTRSFMMGLEYVYLKNDYYKNRNGKDDFDYNSIAFSAYYFF